MQESLPIRDLVKQAVTHSVYRLKPNGKLYEGRVWNEDEDILIKLLADDDNQDMLLMLESKVKSKK
jgi:hypothetical protein